MLRRLAAVLFALVVSFAPNVGAQGLEPVSRARSEVPASAHDVSVGIAVGSILSMDPDRGIRPFHWIASVRYALTEHLVIEPEVGRWSFTRHAAFPAGELTENVGWTSAGANVLARIPIRTVSVFAGGGGGIYFYSTDRAGNMGGSPYSYSHSASGAGLQVLAGLDVRVTRNVIAFGLARAQAVPDAELGTAGLHAGIRYAF